MNKKQKTINLVSWEMLAPDQIGQTRRVWKVTKVTNSVEFSPEQMLDKTTVDGLCAARDWTVNVTSL